MKLSEGAPVQKDHLCRRSGLLRRLLSPTGILVQCLLAIAIVNFVLLVRPALAADPEIRDFEGVQELCDWTFSGLIANVSDPVGVVVTFGGLMDGQSVTCSDPAGLFYHTASPGITTTGTVTASIPGAQTVQYVID